MKILFTICGRAGSKGIRNKNIRNFLGYPLVFYSLAAIEGYVEGNGEVEYEIAVNTDSVELKELCQLYNNLKVECLTRDKTLSGDLVAKIDVIRDCYVRMKDAKEHDYDVIVDLDITSPLRKIVDVKNLITKYRSSGSDIIYSVCPSRRNPYFNMVKKTDCGYEKVIASNFVSRQQAPEVYDMNASLYAYQPDFLLSGKHFNEGKQDVIFMDDTGILDLDKEEDFGLMEAVAKHLFTSNIEYGAIHQRVTALNIKKSF